MTHGLHVGIGGMAKPLESVRACPVLLAKPWKTSCHMSKIYAKDSRSKEVSTGPAIAADPNRRPIDVDHPFTPQTVLISGF